MIALNTRKVGDTLNTDSLVGMPRLTSPGVVRTPAAIRPNVAAPGSASPMLPPTPQVATALPRTATTTPTAGPTIARPQNGLVPVQLPTAQPKPMIAPPAPPTPATPASAMVPTPATPAPVPTPATPTPTPAGPMIAPPAPTPATPTVAPTTAQLPPAAAAATTIPGVGSSTIDPSADLRSQQILPTADPRLTNAQSLADKAVGNLATGPDRTALALQALKDFDTASAKGNAQRYQAIGQNAAKFGRIGMNDTERQTQDLGVLIDQERNQYQNQLAKEVADGTINDRFQTVGTLSGYESGIAGEGAANRNEVRGERDYQTSAAQQAIDNAANERKLAEDLANSSFNRDVTKAGVGQNLSNLEGLLAAGHTAGAEGAANDIGSLLSAYTYGKAAPAVPAVPQGQVGVDGLPPGMTIDDLLAAIGVGGIA